MQVGTPRKLSTSRGFEELLFLMTEIVRTAAVIFNEKSAALSSFEDIEINNFL